jgi:hypothetical protein
MSSKNRAEKRTLASNDINETAQPAKRARKPITPRSFVWEYFRKIHNPDQVQCILCNKTVSYVGRNTNGMSSHLKTNHDITEQWVKDKKKEEDLARSDMDDASIDENEEEENEISSQEIERLVQGNKFCHLVLINLSEKMKF